MGPNALKFFHSLARKGLTKNRGSGITEIADRMVVESEAASMIQTIVDSGLPLERFDQFIRSEADVLKFLNIIKNVKPVSTTEKASGTILPFKQKRSFAEEIDAMKKSGDIVDPANLKKNDNVLTREMFQNSNLNKVALDRDRAIKAKSRIEEKKEETIMDRINNANNRINEIKKEQAEMYRPKTDAEIKAKFERQNKEAAERLRKKQKEAMDDMKEIEDPEEFAKGGRIGFRAGKFVLDKVIANLLKDKKKVQQAADDIFPTGDYKYDAEMAADAFVENNPQIFKNLLREDLSDEVSSEIYGAVLKPIMSNMAKMRELRKVTRPEKTLKSMKENKTIDMSDPEIADEFGRFMKETDPEGYKKLEQTVELSNFDPKKVKGNAEGGRIGYYTGGITDIEPSLDDIGHGSDSLMSRTRLMSPGSQTTTSTGLNYLLAEDNDNLRVPFAGGGGGRRAFLKMMGLTGAGIAGVKSGIIGLGEGTTKKAITETVKQSAGSGRPPPYFFKLVDKIKFMGDDTLPSQDKAIAKKYKDYFLEEDFAGNIEIKKTNYGMFGDEIAPTEEVYMSYRVDDVPVKGKKGSTKVEEYEEYTARPDEDGKMKDVEDGVPEDVLDDAGDPDSMTLKKADGGRIGYNIGGLSKLGINSTSRRFLEKIFGKGSLDEMFKRDPNMHRGMLEVVEMFRKRDKEGLKMYMQKFLPHMDDEMVEDFIVGSGGTEGIEGQLIRLGSGRDYAGKLEMMQKLNNVKKLENLDVTDEMIRKPNSDGGRIGLFLGGPLLKNQLTSGKGLLREMLNYMSKGSSSGKTGSEMLQMVNPKQFEKLLNDPSMYNKISPESGITAPELIKNMIKKTKDDRTGMIEELLSSARNIKKVDDDMIGYKNKIIEEMINKGIDREMAETFADMMSKKIMKEVGPKRATPEITEKGLLELENIQKNLINKDRKLQAQGGLTTMLGE